MRGLSFLCVALVLNLDVSNGTLLECPATGIHFLPHPTSCGKFIQCTSGGYEVFPCGGDFHFNPELGWCQPPEQAGCTIEDNITEDEDDDIDIDEEYEILPDDESSDSNESATPPEGENGDIDYEDQIPPNEGEYPASGDGYPPIDDDDVIEEEEDMSSGDKYPPTDNEDLPEDDENVSSGDKYPPIDDEDLSGEDENGSGDEYPPTDDDALPGEDENISDEVEGSGEVESEDDDITVDCPATGQYFLPHPTSCSRFIKCNNGVSRTVDCIDGLHFDSVWGWCDDPSVVNCVLPEQENEDITTEEPDTAICPATGQYFLPHPSSCSQFVKCNNGQYREVDCVDGLHFDPTMGWCDDPAVVNCTIDESTTEGSLVYCPDNYQHFFPHPSRCSQFIECNYGKYQVLDCIGGLYFNPEAGHCDFPSNVNCKIENRLDNLVDCPKSGQHFYSYPGSCSKYIECNRGEYMVLDCAHGLHFDATKGWCDLPTSPDCAS